MKSGPLHRTLDSHGSSQCLFLRFSGTYDSVIISGSGVSAIGSYSSAVDVVSSLLTVSTWGGSLPSRMRTGEVCTCRPTLVIGGVLSVGLCSDSYQIANLGSSLSSSNPLSLLAPIEAVFDGVSGKFF